MKKIIAFLGLSVLLATKIYSSHFFVEPFKEKNFANIPKNDNRLLANEAPRNIDVLSYDLEVDWVEILPSTKDEPEKRKWNGKIKIVLTPLENNLSVVELDAVKLQINSIKINDNPLENIPSNADGILKIPLENPINTTDTIAIIIDYLYNNPENRGFGHRNSPIPLPPHISIGTHRPSAGTLSQTNNARYWFPGNDRPSDKAIFTAKATVPYKMTAASNGILDSTTINYVDGERYSETFFWRNTEPMPTYLFTIAASEYTSTKGKIKMNSTSDDSVDVEYYYWEEDWDGSNTHNVQRMLAPTEKTMMIFSDLFGDYAYPKYGVAIVDYSHLGFNSVGMEHQTLSTVSRNWVRSFLQVPEFIGFAHELAHHWFGNLVTCHTWKDLWFQEGAASWLEAIYAERIYETVDKNRYYNQQLNHRLSYFNHIASNPIVFETPMYGLDDETGIFTLSSLVYAKASWIYHQLRELVGDEKLFPLMRELLNNHRFGSISTEQFVDFWVEKVPNPPLDLPLRIFLEQWIYQAGHPQYAISSSSAINDNQRYDISITLTQTQVAPNVPAVFVMPLEILFYKNNAIVHTENILNNVREDFLNFTVDADIDSISLNHRKFLFQIIENNHTNIAENHFVSLKIHPNPAINTDEIFIELQNEPLQSIEIIDVLGRTVKEGFDIIQANNFLATVRISSLESGFYFVKLNNRHYEKLMIIKHK